MTEDATLPVPIEAVIDWERYMREVEHAASSTIRRRLAALSSLYEHLVRHGHAARNPVGEVERPAMNRDEGSTFAFAKAEARMMLDMPAENTVAGIARSRDPLGRVAPRRDRRAQGFRLAPEPRL
jgi:integrase/recombinase XerD